MAEEKEKGTEAPKEGAEDSAAAVAGASADVGDTGKQQDDSDKKAPSPEMAKLRQENASRRVENRELKERLEALELKMSEGKRAAELEKMEETDRQKAIAEDAEKKAAAAEARAKLLTTRAEEAVKRSAIVSAASQKGFIVPADAASLINLANISVGEDGSVDQEQVKAEIEALAEERPQYIRQESPTRKTFGPTNSAGASGVRSSLRAKVGTDSTDRLRLAAAAFNEKTQIRDAVNNYCRAWEQSSQAIRNGWPYDTVQEEGE